MELGKQIYELRKKANLSQEQLAEKVGVSRQTIQNGSLVKQHPTSSKRKFCRRYLTSVWTS